MPHPKWRKWLLKTVQKEPQSPPSQKGEKGPNKRGERPPEIEIVFFMLEGHAPTLPSTLRVHMG